VWHYHIKYAAGTL